MKRIKVFVLIFVFLASIVPISSAQETSVIISNLKVIGSFDPAFSVYRGELYFQARSEVSGEGYELWKYDGANVTLVADIWPGPNDSGAMPVLIKDDILYFTANDGVHGYELWKYDGFNFSLVEDVEPGPASSSPSQLVEYNEKIYFWARNASDSLLFMEYDGVSTRIILDVGPGDSDRPKAVVYNNELYFFGYDVAHGRELWKFDGTTASFVAEIRPGPNNTSAITDLIVFQNNLYFSAYDGGVNYGRALWRYDGNAVTLAADINPEPNNSELNFIVEYNGSLYFGASNPSIGKELWRFDGINATLAADINPSGSSNIEFITLANGFLYFSASGSTETGQELWKFDGVTSSASLIEDIYFGPLSSTPSRFTSFQGTIVFEATRNATRLLWKLVPGGAVCLPETDYDPDVVCSNSTVVVNDEDALEQYLNDFGFDGTSYQNLDVVFDLAQPTTEIHSPCQITLNNINITGDSVCIDGREGVVSGSGVVDAAEVTVLSEAGNISYGNGAIIQAERLTVDALRRVTLGSNMQIDVADFTEIKSSGNLSNSSVVFHNNSVLNTDHLSVEGVNVNIGSGNQINVGNEASLIATGTGGGNEVKLSQGAQIFAESLDMSSGSKAILGANAMVTTSGNFNMDAGAPNKCSIANSAVINAGSTSGSCF